MSVPPTMTLMPGCDPLAPETGTVFFVEDQDYLADMIVMIFKREGVRAIGAKDGAEALRLARQNPSAISLALVDVCLPDMSGDQLCRQLRALRPRLPVLLTSGNDMGEFMAALAEGGPTASISKPYRPVDLMKQVRALLSPPVAA